MGEENLRARFSAPHAPPPTHRRGRQLLAGCGYLLLSPFQFLFALTGAGWAFLGVIVLTAVVAVRLQFNQLPFLVAMLLVSALLVATVLPGLSLRRVILRRTIPARIWAGQTARVELTVLNGKKLIPCAGVRIREVLRAAPGTGVTRVFAPIVPPGHAARLAYSLRVRRRGVYTFFPTQLRTTFPLGLLTGRAECQIETELLVYPRLGTLRDEVLDDAERFFETIRRSRPCLTEEDFRGLREFRHGDNPKWIHWRSSARRGELLVREFERPETRRVTVILDTCFPPGTERREGNLELAISFAGSLARDAVLRGFEATFAAFAPAETVLELSRERRNLDVLYEVLARLRPTRCARAAEIVRVLPPGALNGTVVLVVSPGPVFRGEAGETCAAFQRHDNRVRAIDATTAEFRRLFTRDPADADNREEAATQVDPPVSIMQASPA